MSLRRPAPAPSPASGSKARPAMREAALHARRGPALGLTEGASAWARLTLAGKCYMKNPQVDQMEVVGAPLPNAPRDAWAQESGEKKKGPGNQESRNLGSEKQPAGKALPSAPMDTSLTPLLAMKSRALLTLEILCTLILPLSGLARRSPE